MAKYGKAAGKSVKRAMHKKKKGTLKSGRSGKKVKSRKQAIAIGLSEARKKGAKVPKKNSSKKKRSSKKKSEAEPVDVSFKAAAPVAIRSRGARWKAAP